MNILLTFDHSFVNPSCVLIYSISKNTSCKNTYYIPYAENDPFTSNEIKKLERYKKKHDKLCFIKIPMSSIIYASDRKRWGYYNWLKLTSLFYLPKGIEKILYIDSDMILNMDVIDFYKQDISNHPFFGVNELADTSDFSIALDRLKVSQNGVYICAGILLINPQVFINKIPNVNTLKNVINNTNTIFKYDEQDFINYYFHNNILFTKGRSFNFFALWSKQKKDEKIVVYHFATSPKPWVGYDYTYPFRNYLIYWKYGVHIFGIFRFTYLFLKIIRRFFIKHLSR